MFDSLDDGTVHIYYFCFSEDGYNREIDLYAELNEKEKGRYEKIKIIRKKREFLISRIMLRRILSHYCHMDINDICFSYNKYGKPYLNEEFNKNLKEPIYFNLSHAGKVIVCAITKKYEVGVDVESIDRDILNIAQAFYSEDDIAYLNQMPKAIQNKVACRIWTLKEAYVKAKGMGLSMPLDSFNVLGKCDMFIYSSETIPDYYLSVAIDCKQNFIVQEKKLNLTFFI